MSKINSRQKGKRGEREFAQYLTEKGYPARRGVQFSGGPDSPDVVSDLPIHFEVKYRQSFSVYEHVEQACKDCPTGKWRLVALRKNEKPWLAVMPMEDFISVLNTLKELYACNGKNIPKSLG